MNTKRYPSDMTDGQWDLIHHFFEKQKGPGRPATVDYRSIVNAIFYISRTGCQWRMLPHDYPPWQTVAYYFYKWGKDKTLQRIHDTLREVVREEERPTERTTASVDSQSTDSHGTQEARGFHGGKKLDGRKRHLVVDSLGLLLAVVVTAGDVSDPEGGKACLEQMDPEQYPKVETIFGDKAYPKEGFPESIEHWKPGCQLNVISRPENSEGFVKLPIRWVVERTNAWLTKNRRLCRSYEHTVASEVAYIRVAMISIMLRRFSQNPPQSRFGYKKIA
jgi:putative transposase